MKGTYSLALAIALTLAACGGSSTQSDTTPDGSTTTAAQDTAATTDTAAGDTETTTTVAVQALGDGDDSTTFYGNPPGTGTVEIGDITYEFDLNILCLSMAGAMGVVGEASDGSSVSVDADFPPEGWETSGEDWEPPSITVGDDERDVNWQSGGVAADMYPEGSSQIDSFSNDGRLAVGEATFVNSYTFGDELVVAEGRFEFHCPAG